MRDPYLVLGIPEEADDAAVERAYLSGITQSPPERDAERFQALRTAYESLRSRRDRVAHRLFDSQPPEPADVLDRVAPVGPARRPELTQLQALLRGEA